MSEFWLSILVVIGIMVIGIGITAWLTIRRIREEETRSQ